MAAINYFQIHFREWKFCILLKISLKFLAKVSNWQYPSIGLDNGLAPNRRQAIIWTNDDSSMREFFDGP